MLIKNDFIYLDIFTITPNIREKLHLTDKELNFTEEDIELISTSKYVDMEELRILVKKANFKNFEVPKEIGITKAMWSMTFGEKSVNHRGFRMRTIIAILNAIRNRNIQDPFDKVLVKGEIK